MAALLFLVVVVIGLILWARSQGSASRRGVASSPIPVSETVAQRATSQAAIPPPPPAPPNVLQPFSPIPLTVEGASPEAIQGLRAILNDDKTYGRARRDRVLEWLLTTNARVIEIDQFIADWGGQF